jgi:nitrate reductase molybdenum cofactor assembly chaperone NarJ/NarW
VAKAAKSCMKKISTGGFGVIDLEKLHEQKSRFAFFARQLMYPEKLDFHPDVWTEALTAGHPAYPSLQKYWHLMQKYSFEQIEEMYVQTFDFQKDTTLYMTFYKYEDSRERGALLVRLKQAYELFGLAIEGTELSDYLPLMCEFLYAAPWQGHEQQAASSLDLMLAVMEDGTYHLLNSLEKADSPYFHLIQGLRETFKACVIQEAPGT